VEIKKREKKNPRMWVNTLIPYQEWETLGKSGLTPRDVTKKGGDFGDEKYEWKLKSTPKKGTSKY